MSIYFPDATLGSSFVARWCAVSKDEPGQNSVIALRAAAAVAAEQARKSGKTYIVAMGLHPSPAVYVLACDHPDTANPDMDIMFGFFPNGQRFERDDRLRSH